ncbi:MAG: hypothetical protein COB04_18730 [Gammaproteobacteria bacterium]|nr:MAG: hypothetical protein COB04_18730 [Gammaproteobacteria bacterium]
MRLILTCPEADSDKVKITIVNIERVVTVGPRQSHVHSQSVFDVTFVELGDSGETAITDVSDMQVVA